MDLSKALRKLPKMNVKDLLKLHEVDHSESDSSDEGKDELDEEYFTNRSPPIPEGELLNNVARLSRCGKNKVDLKTTEASKMQSTGLKKSSKHSMPRLETKKIEISNSFSILREENLDRPLSKIKENSADQGSSSKKSKKNKKKKKGKKENKKEQDDVIDKDVLQPLGRYLVQTSKLYSTQRTVLPYSFLLNSRSKGCAPLSCLINVPPPHYWDCERIKLSTSLPRKFYESLKLIRDARFSSSNEEALKAQVIHLTIPEPYFDLYIITILGSERVYITLIQRGVVTFCRFVLNFA